MARHPEHWYGLFSGIDLLILSGTITLLNEVCSLVRQGE